MKPGTSYRLVRVLADCVCCVVWLLLLFLCPMMMMLVLMLRLDAHSSHNACTIAYRRRKKKMLTNTDTIILSQAYTCICSILYAAPLYAALDLFFFIEIIIYVYHHS